MPSTMVDATVATPPLDLTGRRQRRRPVALSDANANAGAVAAAYNKPKAKIVASRYLTPPSKPATSIVVSAAASPAAPRPHASTGTERSRPAQPSAVVVATDAVAPCGSAAAATTTTRTLAVAFQSPTYSLETTRARSAGASPPTVPAPEKKTYSSSNPAGTAARAKVSDASQNTYRWPAASATPPPPCGLDGRALAQSTEHSAASSSRKETATAAAIIGAVRPAAAALHGTPRRASVDGGANEYLLALSSDTDSSASSAGSGGDGGGGGAPARRSVHITSSSARFTRDAARTRSERFSYYPATATPLPSRTSGTSSPAPAPAPAKKRSLFNGLLSSPFGRPSLKHPSPPSKPFRRTPSTSPARRSTDSAGKSSSSAGCGFDGDTRLKPSSSAIKAEEEHQLKLLYTRELQWRFANAQAGAALSLQTMAAEKTLSGAWIAILRMRKSVAIRKMQLQLLQHNCKLMAILRGQMKYLEEWSFLERDYAHSLSGTTEALNATVLRLPVSNGAMLDIQGIKSALSSAVDVMHTIGNSTSARLPKLAQTNVLASQLSRVFIQEHILITECGDLLSTTASMHVKYSSLQGQRIQMNQRRRQQF